jgi:hypothetical protein
MATDATVVTVPDTDANLAAFGRAEGGRGATAFPQVRKLSLVEVGTHAEVAFVAKGFRPQGSGSEQSLMPALLSHVGAGMLLMGDSGLYSYALWQKATATGAHLLIRLIHAPGEAVWCVE